MYLDVCLHEHSLHFPLLMGSWSSHYLVRVFSLHPYLATRHRDFEIVWLPEVWGQPTLGRRVTPSLPLPHLSPAPVHCTWTHGILLSSDLYKHKFINCRFINTTFLAPKEGCHMDFEQDNDFLIYLVSFLGSLSVLPGNIISALLMDRVGRLKMIGE